MSTQSDFTKPNAAGGACNLVVGSIFAYFFYIYAFQNPDKGECFAKVGNETGYPAVPVTTTGTGEDALRTPQVGFTDVSEKFT